MNEIGVQNVAIEYTDLKEYSRQKERSFQRRKPITITDEERTRINAQEKNHDLVCFLMGYWKT